MRQAGSRLLGSIHTYPTTQLVLAGARQPRRSNKKHVLRNHSESVQFSY